MTDVIETYSEEETYKLGFNIGQKAEPGLIITLIGDLGVGKTVFAKGLAEGLGIEEDVCSPTFTILHEYHEGRLSLFHFDVYRIDDPDEMYEIGYEDYFFGDGVCLVEWADNISDLIPKTAGRITIEKDTSKGFDYRKITLENIKVN